MSTDEGEIIEEEIDKVVVISEKKDSKSSGSFFEFFFQFLAPFFRIYFFLFFYVGIMKFYPESDRFPTNSAFMGFILSKTRKPNIFEI